MKGQILDVSPEGKETFRACVLKVIEGSDYPVNVVNLDTGVQTFQTQWECDTPIIPDIFELPFG